LKSTFSLLSVCILYFILFYSCSKVNEELAEAQFICTVDYVEFTSDVTANVKFDVIVDGISDLTLRNILTQLKTQII